MPFNILSVCVRIPKEDDFVQDTPRSKVDPGYVAGEGRD
jgi:hypothetical protein